MHYLFLDHFDLYMVSSYDNRIRLVQMVNSKKKRNKSNFVLIINKNIKILTANSSSRVIYDRSEFSVKLLNAKTTSSIDETFSVSLLIINVIYSVKPTVPILEKNRFNFCSMNKIKNKPVWIDNIENSFKLFITLIIINSW